MNSMSLVNIETDLMDCLLNRQQDDAQFVSNLVPVMNLSPTEQLAIYRSHLNGAHEKTLQQVYPAIHRILGEDYFTQLVRQYRFENPSVNRDLNIYGQYFSDFLYQQIQLHEELTEFTYLPDLAEHEFSWHSSYFAENNIMFDFNQFITIPENDYDKLIFSVSPSFSIHQTDFPVIDIWTANREATTSSQNFPQPEESIYYCIYRPGYHPEYAIIDQQQHQLLTAIINKQSLSRLAAEYSHTLQVLLLHFIEKQWVTGFRLME